MNNFDTIQVLEKSNQEVDPILFSRPDDSARDRSYSQVIVWKDYEQKTGRPRPYDTPFDEWVDNIHEPTRTQLMSRWEDMPEQSQITVFWRSPKAMIERKKRQFERNRELDDAFLDSQEYKIKRRRQEVMVIELHISMVDRKIEQEKTKILSREAGPDGYNTKEMEFETPNIELRRLLSCKDMLLRMRDRLEGVEYDDGEGEEDIATRLVNVIQTININNGDRSGFNEDLAKSGLSKGRLIDALPMELK
jgi:hypothetical protein